MKSKTAIITGSSSGFGLHIALDLAKRGVNVIATMRDVQKAQTLINAAKKLNLMEFIRIHPLDVASPDSIRQFHTYLKELKYVDILINNAGTAVGGFCEELSIEDYERAFKINLFGVIHMTQAVLPYMRAQNKGRILNISSISGRFGFPGLSAYSATKHALEGFSESLRLEVKPFGIDVVLIEPGSYKTNIWTSMDGVHVSNESAYYPLMSTLKNIVENGKDKHGDPEEVAKLVGKIATQNNTPDLRYPIGKNVSMMIRLKNLFPWKIIEKIILKRLQQ